MARPPLALGHHGTVTIARDDGRWVARCRVRDFDGVTRRAARWASTRTGAQAALQQHLSERSGRSQRPTVLRQTSRFNEAADVWIAKVHDRRADSSAGTYETWLKNVVRPQLGELLIRECDIAILDDFFRRLEREQRKVMAQDGTVTARPRYAANSRRTVRSIVSGVLQQAVLHQAIPSNPIRELERIESTKGHAPAKPRGLTAEERRRLLDHVDGNKRAVTADLPDIIRFGLGTGLRIGEICAVRWMDVNLTGLVVGEGDEMRQVPVVAVRQNVYPVSGKGLVVHGGKSPMALRIVPLPQFVVERLRGRRHGDEPAEMPVFASAGRDGRPTYRWPSNLRRQVRAQRVEVGLEWMTPHTWRRTYATILDDEITLTDRAKADLLGQSKFLKDTYVSRGELHPDAAIYLDAALQSRMMSGRKD